MPSFKDTRHGRHCVFDLHVHLVFLPKYRGKVFASPAFAVLKGIFSKVCEDFESRLVEFDGQADHVHLLVAYPPKVSVSSLANSLKGVSSRLLRKHGYPGIRIKPHDAAFWSSSYFAGSCGGAPIDVIRRYIENQRHP
jgi:putative transposase